MLIDYLPILLLFIFAVLFAAVNIILSHKLGPQKPTRSKLSPYESGLEPITSARQRFLIRFDLIAMLFIIFDIEIVFIYPWALVFDKLSATGIFILIEMVIFMGMLFLGYIYAWKKGALSWD